MLETVRRIFETILGKHILNTVLVLYPMLFR